MTLTLVVVLYQELLSRLALAMTLPKSWKWHCQSLVKRRAGEKARPRKARFGNDIAKARFGNDIAKARFGNDIAEAFK